jgi:hypothetical protein
MNLSAKKENARTLASALGIAEDAAMDLLAASVAITHRATDNAGRRFAEHVRRMIGRTVARVILEGDTSEKVAVELVIGDAEPRFESPRLYASMNGHDVVIGGTPGGQNSPLMHPVGILLGASYAVGAMLKKTFNDLLPFPPTNSLNINLIELLGDDLRFLSETVDIDESFLVGAGAVGNGFAYALREFKARGVLHVVDDDFVSGGNLQRCIYFDESQEGLNKCDCLCAAIADDMPNVKAIPHKARLQDIKEKKAGPWLKRLIVAVDSPRARRSIQTEIPREVYDVSTTGISEIVFHFHSQPTELACLSCAYHESPEELAHEKHVAEALGVSLADVRTERISPEIACAIQSRNPQFQVEELTGLAYDSLFKKMCATGKLLTPEGRQVLAPFAFVSVLAGTFLAIEFVRRIHNQDRQAFNDWCISPWANPVLRRRRNLQKRTDCEFCGDERIARVLKTFWAAP